MEQLSLEEPAHFNPLDDVFDDEDEVSPSTETRRNNEISDVPRLQGIHATNGYREGVAASKEKFLQEGFDEGYALGAEMGAAAGRIVGVLESLRLAIEWENVSAKEELVKMVELARGELASKSLYGSDYFGDDGIWKYEVIGEADSDEVTFRIVASNHPLIRKWEGYVTDVLETYKLAA